MRCGPAANGCGKSSSWGRAATRAPRSVAPSSSRSTPGQTFGLGQLNPLTALKVNDLVRSRYRRARRLKASQAGAVYQAIMDPDVTLMTMAAVIRNSIDVYARTAGVDISGNPGITATLYNLGKVEQRAPRARQEAQEVQGLAAGELLRLAGERPPRRSADRA